MLKLWSNEQDLVVAESPEDATKILVEEEEMHPADVAGWPPWAEHTAPIPWLEDECQPISEAPLLTPAEVIAKRGRGYVPTMPL